MNKRNILKIVSMFFYLFHFPSHCVFYGSSSDFHKWVSDYATMLIIKFLTQKLTLNYAIWWKKKRNKIFKCVIQKFILM